MIATPVFQGLAVTVISLFLIQLAKSLTANATNPFLVGIHDGTAYLTS